MNAKMYLDEIEKRIDDANEEYQVHRDEVFKEMCAYEWEHTKKIWGKAIYGLKESPEYKKYVGEVNSIIEKTIDGMGINKEEDMIWDQYKVSIDKG